MHALQKESKTEKSIFELPHNNDMQALTPPNLILVANTCGSCPTKHGI